MRANKKIGYRIIGTIKKVKGFCNAAHKKGDEIELSGHSSGGLCGFFYHDIFPYIIIQFLRKYIFICTYSYTKYI